MRRPIVLQQFRSYGSYVLIVLALAGVTAFLMVMATAHRAAATTSAVVDVVAMPNPAALYEGVIVTATFMVPDTDPDIVSAAYSVDSVSSPVPMSFVSTTSGGGYNVFEFEIEIGSLFLGTHTIDVTGTDNGGGTHVGSTIVAVYDPAAGFVTGGGSFTSPAGAYKAVPGLTGIAMTAFVAKYKKGKNTPIGNTEFHFKAADLNFHSDSYEVLIVNKNDARAQFMGEGTLNGANAPSGDPFKFKVWALDGDLSGLGPDRVRVKIWDEGTLGSETVIYDNGDDSTSPDGTALDSGQVKIQMKSNIPSVSVPFIAELDPDTGGPGTSVTISGSNFNNVDQVNFGANGASFTVDSDAQISTTSPAGSGTVNVIVSTPAAMSNAVPYFYNQPPVAQDDSFTTNEDTVLNGSANVLADNGNGIDDDPDGDSLTVTEVNGIAGDVGMQITLSSGALLTLNANGTFSYDPNGAFDNLAPSATSSDGFGYTIEDGNGGSDSATVTITIEGVDDPPVAVNDSATVSEDDTATTIDVLTNDTDVDGGPISVDSVTQPTNGTVAITGGGSGLTYQPDANYCNDGSPTDDFTYTLSPGSSTATVHVTVTCVDDPPVAVNDSATVSEDDPATAIDVLTNDTDIDDGPISVDSVTQPTNGTVVNSGTDVSYTPDANYCNDGSPTDDFTYTLSPGSSTATVHVTVTCVDDPPVAVNDSATVSEDDPATAIDVLTNDTDIDGGPISVDSVTQPTNGTVVNNGTDVSYTPDANYCNDGSPTDDFTYTLSPGSSTATVHVTVTCVNDPPVVVAPGPFASVGNVGISVPPGPNGLLSNVSDPADGDGAAPFTVAAGSITSTNGGTVTPDTITGAFTYIPAPGFEGDDTFDYQVCDSGVPGSACTFAEVTVTVSGMIWFIDNSSAATPADGRLNNPFQTLAAFEAVNGNGGANDPAAGDDIFLYTGTADYTGGVTLENNQRLIGQGVTDTSLANILGPTLPAFSNALPSINGSRPVLVSTSNGITLASGNTIRGLNIGNTTGTGIAGTSVGTVTANEVSVSGNGAGVSINTGTLAMSFDELSSNNAAGINLSAVTGNFDVTTGTINSGNSTAISISSGTTVDLDITLVSVSSNGAPNGILLENTTGSFAVTGDGTASSGGTISGATSSGISLTNTQNVSFTDVTVDSSTTTDTNAVHATTVTGLTFDRCTVTAGSASSRALLGAGLTDLTIQNESIFDGGGGSVANIDAVFITNLLGNSAFTNSTFRHGKDLNVVIENDTATGNPDVLTISNGTTFSNSAGGDHLQVEADTNANLSLVINDGGGSNVMFSGTAQDAMQLEAQNNGQLTAAITQATISGNTGSAVNMATVQNGTLTATIQDLVGLSSGGGTNVINMIAFDTSTIASTVSNNSITTGTNGAGIRMIAEGSNPTVTAHIIDNMISGATLDNGILAQARAGSGHLNLTIDNNTVSLSSSLALDGIEVTAGASAGGDTTNVCLNLLNNDSSSAGLDGYFLHNRSGNTFRLQDFTGDGSQTADIMNWVTNVKGNTGTVFVSIGAPFAGEPLTCPLPPTP